MYIKNTKYGDKIVFIKTEFDFIKGSTCSIQENNEIPLYYKVVNCEKIGDFYESKLELIGKSK